MFHAGMMARLELVLCFFFCFVNQNAAGLLFFHRRGGVGGSFPFLGEEEACSVVY